MDISETACRDLLSVFLIVGDIGQHEDSSRPKDANHFIYGVRSVVRLGKVVHDPMGHHDIE